MRQRTLQVRDKFENEFIDSKQIKKRKRKKNMKKKKRVSNKFSKTFLNFKYTVTQIRSESLGATSRKMENTGTRINFINGGMNWSHFGGRWV